MSPTVVTIDIARPAGAVFAYATDPTRFGEWQQGVIDGPLDTAGAAPGGARCLTTAVDFEGHGIGKILVPLLVQRQARKEMPGNIATLKRRVESEHSRRLA